MAMRNTLRCAPLAALLVLGACSDSTGPADLIDDDEAADIVLEVDAMTGGMLFEHVLLRGFGADGEIGVASGDIREISRERSCPLGGSVTMSGQVERTVTDDAVEFSASASGSWNACVRGTRHNDRTFTIDGSFQMSAFRRYVDRQPAGPQTTTKSGSFTMTRSDGESRSCEYDITSTRYPEEQRRVVTGSICGREVNREVSWRPSDG
jgi:hypothetical protein